MAFYRFTYVQNLAQAFASLHQIGANRKNYTLFHKKHKLSLEIRKHRTICIDESGDNVAVRDLAEWISARYTSSTIFKRKGFRVSVK